MFYPWSGGDPMFGDSPVWAILAILGLCFIGGVVATMTILTASQEGKNDEATP